jgi:hypothetical protein
MPELAITVRGRIAQAVGKLEIIGGNSDYAVTFDFDDEWLAYPAKTARFVWLDATTQKTLYSDVLFEGDTVLMPPIGNTNLVGIGIYAGDIITTTPAYIPCYGCISDGAPPHEQPPEDIYLQLINYMDEIAHQSHRVDPARLTMLTSFYRSAPLLAAPETARLVPVNRWNFWQETNDNAKTTATLTATPTASCLLVAAVMHRGNTVSIEGDGWTKVIDGKWTTLGSYDQQITVWTKSVSAGTHSVTVTQSTESGMSMKLIALYEAAGLTVTDDAVLASVPYTPAAKTGKRRLYALSSIYASSADNPPNAVTATYSGIDLRTAGERRFSAFYDYDTESSAVPSFSYFSSNYVANSMNALAFDIEEG